MKNLVIRDPMDRNRIVFYLEGGEKDIENYRDYEVEGYTLELTDLRYTRKWGVYWETGNEEGDYQESAR